MQLAGPTLIDAVLRYAPKRGSFGKFAKRVVYHASLDYVKNYHQGWTQVWEDVFSTVENCSGYQATASIGKRERAQALSQGLWRELEEMNPMYGRLLLLRIGKRQS